MKIYVGVNNRESWHTGDWVLQHESWNDWWEYENLYTLYMVNATRIIEMGSLKIGQLLDNDSAVPNLPDKFEYLDPKKFITLGQDVTYYENIGKAAPEVRDELLIALNDIAYNSDLLDQNIEEKVVKSSLMRSVPYNTIKYQLNRIAHGGVTLTNYNFQYNYPHNPDSPSPLKLEFNVDPESAVPTNVHVIIGRNGVGKTWLIKSMINSSCQHAQQVIPQQGYFTFDNNGEITNQNSFSNIVCLAFSAFDKFDESQGTDILKYTHIGVCVNESEGYDLSDSLAAQFAQSLVQCVFNSAKYDRWKMFMRLLDSDPVFAEINMINCIETVLKDHGQSRTEKRYDKINDIKKDFQRVFERLSSGHKIVALAITRLVETVEERTLVLLDEPEMHLHPPLLSAFVRALSQLLINRNGVAIIATHSPVILQEVPSQCVWIIRRVRAKVAAERPAIATFGENVGVLTSEIFGLEVRNSGFHKILYDTLKKFNGDYDLAKQYLGKQLGAEGLAILKVMALNYGQGDVQ